MLVGVKYCGGCRAAFDRKAEACSTINIVSEMAAVTQNVSYAAAVTGEAYDVLLVVCGCRSRCPDIGQYSAGMVIYIDEAAGAARAGKDLASLVKRV